MKDQEEKNYEEKIAAQVQQQRAEIEKLKGKVSEKKADAKIAYQENIKKLEVQQAELENRFEKLKSSSGDAWKELKSGFLDAWNDLSDSMKKAKDNF